MRDKLAYRILLETGGKEALYQWAERLSAKYEKLAAEAAEIDKIDRWPERVAAEQQLFQKSGELVAEAVQWADALADYGGFEKTAMEKTADPFSAIVGALANAASSYGTAAVVGLPAVIGVSLAYAKNKVTSPSESTIKNAQKDLYLTMVKKRLAEIKRKKALKEYEEKQEKNTKTLRML